MEAKEYQAPKKQELIPISLGGVPQIGGEEYDILVLEGAGSPAGDQPERAGHRQPGMAKLSRSPVVLVGISTGRGLRLPGWHPLLLLDEGGTQHGQRDGHQQVPGMSPS